MHLEFVLEPDEMIPKNSTGGIKIKVQKYFKKKAYVDELEL